jgi:dihydropyrimidine dehydrogenase (NAD+) subunit PreT
MGPGHPELIDARFADLHPSLAPQPAVVEANRCLNCFDAPCTAACPTHIDVPGFIKKIARDNLRGSALRILDANILGLSCSRVCPVDILCEGSCVMHARGESAIKIGMLQRYAMENFYDAGARIDWVPMAQRPQHIACIGGGPASLSCAAELRRWGFPVTVFEGRSAAGGLNTHGVAEYKLNSRASLREVGFVKSLGVEIATGKLVGEDIPLAVIESKYDAIFVGVGLGAGYGLDMRSEGAPPVIDALQFIEAYKRGEPIAIGLRVIVIGGGNTAIDAACAARRLGAGSVLLAYRRSETEMPAFQFEIAHARSEGVQLLFQFEPAGLRAGSVQFRRMRLKAPDATGRRSAEAEPGSEFTLGCDTVITAIGQSKLVDLLERFHGVKLREGRVAIDPATGRTSNPKYFAGGDCVSGGAEVVDAVADGKRAALAICAMFPKEVPVG